MGLLGILASHARQVLGALASGQTPAQVNEQCALLRRALEEGDLARATRIEQKLSAQHPQRADVLLLRGRLARAKGEADQALQHFQLAIEYAATAAEAHFWCAVVHMQQVREAEALAHAQQAEHLRPGNAHMMEIIGTVYHHQGNTSLACSAFVSALQVDAHNTFALRSLAGIYYNEQRWAEALPYYRHLLALEPNTPDLYSACATSLLALGQGVEAWPMFERAIECGRELSSIYNDYGVALFREGRIAEASAQFDAGLRVKDGDAMLHFLRAECDLITTGSTPATWAEYEWRRKLVPAHFAERSQPWSGEPHAGRRVLIYPEQGIGDWLLFARFIHRVAGPGQQTILQVRPALGRLARASAAHFDWGIAEWIESPARVEQDNVRCDYEAPLLSAINLRGFAVEKASVPYLHVEDDLVAHWSTKLGFARDQHLRIGLVWAGNPTRWDDYLRSIPVAQLAPLAHVKDAVFVSLQMDAKPHHKAGPLPFEAIDPTPGIRDFADTAAIMRNLDIVLSIDTAAAHLAGALAVPCWVLLSKTLDWRWEMAGVEQPWYASHRSFRVAQQRHWEPLVAEVAQRLNQEREALIASRAR